MIRGTTPTHVFELPVDAALIDKVLVVYAQNGEEVFHKTKKDCQMDGMELSVRLTQTDTLKLSCGYNAQIQLKMLLHDGNVMISNAKLVYVRDCYSNEVIE